MAELVAVGKRNGRFELVRTMNLIMLRIRQGTLSIDEIERCLKKESPAAGATGDKKENQ